MDQELQKERSSLSEILITVAHASTGYRLVELASPSPRLPRASRHYTTRPLTHPGKLGHKDVVNTAPLALVGEGEPDAVAAWWWSSSLGPRPVRAKGRKPGNEANLVAPPTNTRAVFLSSLRFRPGTKARQRWKHSLAKHKRFYF